MNARLLLAGLLSTVALVGCAPAAHAAVPEGAVLVPAGPDLVPADPAARMAGDVTVSADGTLALVGGEASTDKGLNVAAIFSRQGPTWSRQADLPGNASASALSADGTTALISSIFGAGGRSGEASVFVRSGATWTQQGPSFTPYGDTGNSAPWFGASAALSASGDVAVIGAPSHWAQGAVWVYERQGGVWGQGTYLGPDFSFRADRGRRGWDVAISADGTMILSASNNGADTYLRSGGTWAKGPSAPVTGTVSLSADGRTALIGGTVFTWTGSDWQRDSEVVGVVGQGVLSGDASTAVFTAAVPGAGADVRVYARRGAVWAGVGRPLAVPPFTGEYPGRAGVSADGQTVVVGSNQRTRVFVPGAVVAGLTPATGSRGGGEAVTITGEGFVDVRAVQFGAVPARRFTVRSPTRIDAITPPAPAGAAHVGVSAGDATSSSTSADLFRFMTPRISLGTGGLRLNLARPRVRIVCTRVTCAGMATLTGPRGVALARGRFSIAAGGRRTVVLRLTTAGRRAARRRASRYRLVVEIPGAATVSRRAFAR